MTFSQNDDIRLALGHHSQRRLVEASPPDKLWCTSLSACGLRASSTDTWCVVFTYWTQALEHEREIFREKTITPLCNPTLPKTRFPWITHASLSCEIDPVAHIHLNTAPNTAYAQMAKRSAFPDSVPDDYATEVIWPRTKRTDAPLLPE